MTTDLLSDQDRAFLDTIKVARLATADAQGLPHVLPICFTVLDDTLYFTIDHKPKSGDPRRLKRLRNIAANPHAAVIVDRYDHDDWTHLGWIMLTGRADIIASGGEHAHAQAALTDRYRQYSEMALADLPVVAIRIARVSRWGNLAVGNDGPALGQVRS